MLRWPTPSAITICPVRCHRWQRERKKRGKRARICTRLQANQYKWALPTRLIQFNFLTNTCAKSCSTNKMDKIGMRITSHYMNNCSMIITETWLDENILNTAIKLAGYAVHHTDRTKDSSKTKGGGVRIYIHNGWCMATDIIGKHGYSDIEYLMLKCRPFFLPTEFIIIIIVVLAAYRPPQSNAKLAQAKLHNAININCLHTRREWLL